MRKFFLTSIIFIIIGILIGKFIFLEKDILKIFKSKDKYFFLQEGVYNNETNIESSLYSIKNAVLEKKDNKVYVYIGITKDQDIAEQLIEIYKNKNINLNIKEKYINNEEFKSNIEQFDLLIKSSKTEDEIIKIQEVVLANYEEIIKNMENSWKIL